MIFPYIDLGEETVSIFPFSFASFLYLSARVFVKFRTTIFDNYSELVRVWEKKLFELDEKKKNRW